MREERRGGLGRKGGMRKGRRGVGVCVRGVGGGDEGKGNSDDEGKG